MKSPVEQLPRRACAAGLTDSRASRASRATRGDARAARHSPWHAVQCHCSLANAAHRTSRLLTRQHSAAPASSGGRGAAAPPPCPVHGAGTRRHGPPPAARCAPPSRSTRCSLTTRSFAQRSARATPRRADPQSAQEAACGRPGRCPLASSAAMSSARASEQRKSGGERDFSAEGPWQ